MRARRGSALLVVLGMVAFMVISAVAFSAYMRYSRLPSSYLRRASSSRLLAKAALAEAIDQIDRDIGENVHPNVGIRPPRGVSSNNQGNQGVGRNVWAHRVYLGTNNVSNLASPDGTVSTLTLEGLAHIPPPLVNYARYYSRRSQAGRWRSLGFDAGRYAFCAIDVSDFFDVNALAANAGRDSSAAGRITLAHLFENVAHTSYEANPSDWDGSRFMKNFRSESPIAAGIQGQNSAAADTIVPLVSLADFNLALHDKAPGLFTSPFCQYVEQDKKSFYGGLDGSSPEGARIRGMTFVTDACYPSVVGGGADDDYDLADPRRQPWTGDQLLRDPGAVSLGETRTALTEAGQRICSRISGLGMAELYDYLDENNVPVSLAIPSVERTPMVVGFEANLPGASVKINATTVPNNNPTDDAFPNVVAGTAAAAAGATRTIRYQKVYKLDGQAFSAAVMGGSVKAVLAYPFRRGSDVDSPDTFRLDGHLALYLTTGNYGFRSQNPSSLLQVTDDSGKLGPNVQLPDNAAVFHVQLPRTGIALPAPNNSDENAAAFMPADLTGADAAQDVFNAAEQNELLIVTYDEQQTASQNPATGTWFWNRGTPTISDVACNMRPVNASGVIDPDFNPATLRTWLAAGQSRQVTVRAAVWLRVTRNDGKTVDLVPACLEDDGKFLGVSGAVAGPADSDDLGSAYPTMFLTGGTFDFSIDSTTGFDNFSPVQLNFETKSGMKGAMCPDPRWNWAPEHWYAVASVSAGDWVNAAHDFQSGEQGCDRDIFMATSDAGYLQSIWELAFLPRSTKHDDTNENHGYDGLSLGQLETPMDGRTEWGDVTTVRNRRLMWRTYRPYDRTGLERDRFFDGNQPWFVSEGGGCKVNPYSDNLDVLMAAFANTPFDWWAASTNWQAEAAIQKETRLDAKQFNQKYAFNEMNSNAKFAWRDLQAIALSWIEKINGYEAAVQAAAGSGATVDSESHGIGLRDYNGTDVDIWKDKWDELDWDGENSDLCGVTLSNSDQLFDVDRKFLYGYWRDCFAPRQQLFLIFARAEPMMMGGGGSTPPQLGARVVALVWRDPTTTGDNSKPHRTRVLFYRQLD